MEPIWWEEFCYNYVDWRPGADIRRTYTVSIWSIWTLVWQLYACLVPSPRAKAWWTKSNYLGLFPKSGKDQWDCEIGNYTSTSLTTISIHISFERVGRQMFWSLLGYIVAKACTSQRNLTWFTRPFLLVRGWGLGMRPSWMRLVPSFSFSWGGAWLGRRLMKPHWSNSRWWAVTLMVSTHLINGQYIQNMVNRYKKISRVARVTVPKLSMTNTWSL